jgi:hypothetical protein
LMRLCVADPALPVRHCFFYCHYLKLIPSHRRVSAAIIPQGARP